MAAAHDEHHVAVQTYTWSAFVVTVPATAVLQHPAATVCKLLSAAQVPMGLCQVYSGPQVYAQTILAQHIQAC
jgi:hypothetical protein